MIASNKHARCHSLALFQHHVSCNFMVSQRSHLIRNHLNCSSLVQAQSNKMPCCPLFPILGSSIHSKELGQSRLEGCIRKVACAEIRKGSLELTVRSCHLRRRRCRDVAAYNTQIAIFFGGVGRRVYSQEAKLDSFQSGKFKCDPMLSINSNKNSVGRILEKLYSGKRKKTPEALILLQSRYHEDEWKSEIQKKRFILLGVRGLFFFEEKRRNVITMLYPASKI